VLKPTLFYFPKKTDILTPYFKRPYHRQPAGQVSSQTAGQTTILATIALVLGLKDPYTEVHVRRVSTYAGRLATRLGLHPDEVNDIILGGLLHDVGKIGLSDQIFRHTHAHLSEEMVSEVRRHPAMGKTFLQQFNFAPHILEYVLYHHERMDGSGYPCGLIAGEIPIGAKIISVADCFDAIVTDRPYQKGKGSFEALATLEYLGGKYLCPDIVGIFAAEILAHGKIYTPTKGHHPLRRGLDMKGP
jgi:HD-GYP domain-containing protein (c-di-GMP phosphodiesterase class II)